MKVDRIGFTPICFRDPDLDCIPGCPLEGKAVTVISNLARENDVTPAEVIAQIRSMDPVEKAQVRTLISAGLALVNVADKCSNKDRIKPGAGLG